MKVAVITVNYGTAELAAQAVQSVLDAPNAELDVEVHLLDNASPGADATELAALHEARDWGEQVTFWPETTNHGFGRGNNVVLEALAARPPEAQPDFVFLLNPDAALTNDALPHLARALADRPELAAAGAAISNADGSPAVAAFHFPSLASELARIIKFGPLAERYRTSLPAPQPRKTVDWVSGAAVMFRFDALRDVGFFDPGFFLYYEEVDLMRRLTAAGWQVLHVPEASVMHHAGVATGVDRGDEPRPRKPGFLYQSWRHYFTQSLGRPRALALALVLVPAGLANVLLATLRGRQPDLPKHFFRDHWHHVLRPLMGMGDAT